MEVFKTTDELYVVQDMNSNGVDEILCTFEELKELYAKIGKIIKEKEREEHNNA